MNRRRWPVLAMAMALAVALGAGAAALAQMEVIKRQYDLQRKNTDMTSADQVLALARWCYQNELTDESLQYATLANKLAPDDLRPKYLVYALKGSPAEREATTQEVATTADTKPLAPAAVTDKEVDQLFDYETPAVMNGFTSFQTLLLNRCAKPNCHGGQNPKAKFVLVASNPDSTKTRAQNFMAISQYLNRESPADSRLLQVPLKGQEAGHPKKELRTTSDPVYREGVKWIDSTLTDVERVWNKAEKQPGSTPPPGWVEQK